MAATGVAVPNQAAPTAAVVAADTVNVVATTLSLTAASGASSIVVDNPAGLTPGAIITIADGNPEVVEILSISANTLYLVTATQFQHFAAAVVVLAFAQQIVSIGDITQPGARAGLDASGNLRVVVAAGTQATASATWTSGAGWSSAPPVTGVLYGIVVSSPGTSTVRLTDGSGSSAIPLWVYPANEGAGDADPMPAKSWTTGLNWSGTSTGLVVTIFYGNASLGSQQTQITPTSTNTPVPGFSGNGVLYGVLVSTAGASSVKLFDGNGTVVHVLPANSGLGDDLVNTPKPFFGGLFAVGGSSGNPTIVLTLANGLGSGNVPTSGTSGSSSGPVGQAGTSGATAAYVQGVAGGVPQPVSIAGTLAVASVSPAVGAANFMPGQLTLTATSAATIAAARSGASGSGRVSITIVNESTTAIYLGAAGVTSATGLLLPGVVGASVTLPTTAAIYGCLAAAGSALLSFYELY